MSLNRKKELSLYVVNIPFKSIYMWETLVVYLHGQTGWFTVCTNVIQNSGLVNFVLESVNICTNQFHSPENGPENLKSTGTKDGFEEIWNTNFRLEHSIRKNRTAFSDVSLLLEIFH